MQSVIRIGSRESLLAVRQAEIIRDQILRCDPEVKVEIITMKTTGDKILDKSLAKIGGKGLFVKELTWALLDGMVLRKPCHRPGEEMPIGRLFWSLGQKYSRIANDEVY